MNSGMLAGVPTDVANKLKVSVHEVREILKPFQANEILRKVASCSLDRVNRQFHELAPNMPLASGFSYVSNWTKPAYAC